MAGLTSATREAAKGVELYQEGASVRLMDKLRGEFDSGKYGDLDWDTFLKQRGLDELVGLTGNDYSEAVSQLDPKKIRGIYRTDRAYNPNDFTQITGQIPTIEAPVPQLSSAKDGYRVGYQPETALLDPRFNTSIPPTPSKMAPNVSVTDPRMYYQQYLPYMNPFYN